MARAGEHQALGSEGALGRREFLMRMAAAGIAVPSVAAILASCGEEGAAGGPEPIFGTREHPAILQTFDDNPPVGSGLEPEEGPLVLYNWEQNIWKSVLRDFAQKYHVDWRIETFYNMEEAIQKIQTGELEADVFFPTVDVIPRLVAAKQLQPLSHDYLPNMKNVYDSLADPFYDKGSQYTVPYSLYSTGIAWRTDIVPIEVSDLQAMDNPWSFLWDPSNNGKLGIYDTYRGALLLGMFHAVGAQVDVNTFNPADIEAGKNALIELSDINDVRVTGDGAYVGIPEGRFGIHDAYSGDIQVASLNAADPAKEAPLFRYYWPPRDGFAGSAENDTMAIFANAKNPVLAHTFLNFMLDEFNAVKNWTWLGYQPPQKGIDPEALFDESYPGLEGTFGWEYEGHYDNLRSTILTKEDVEVADRQIGLPIEVDILWQNAYAEFKSGV